MEKSISFHLGKWMGADCERFAATNVWYCATIYIVLPAESALLRTWPVLLLEIQKHLFYHLAESTCDLETQWETRVVLAGLNGVHSAAGDSDSRRKLGLRPVLFSS